MQTFKEYYNKPPNRCFACQYLQKNRYKHGKPYCTFGQEGLEEAKYSQKNLRYLIDLGKYENKCIWIKPK